MSGPGFRHIVLELLLVGVAVGCLPTTWQEERPNDLAPSPVRAAASPTPGLTVLPSPSPTVPLPAETPTRLPLPTPSPSPTPLLADTPTSQPPPSSEAYIVQRGDTLSAIARAHGVTVEAIAALNSLENLDVIYEGQVLQMPVGAPAQVALQTTATAPPGPTPVPADAEPVATVLPRPSPTEVALPQVTLAGLRDRLLLGPMAHDWQRMNNCAPTTLAMALSFFGEKLTQYDLAPVLKGSDADKNVSPTELVEYVREAGYGAVLRVSGDLETLMRLVSNGIPVIVEQWLDRPDDELTGHYRLVRGYDRPAQSIIVNDSYNGPELPLSYTEFDRLWWPFNRLYVAIYRLADEPLVMALLGDVLDDQVMFQRAAAVAQTATEANPSDPYAWFNLGNSLLGLDEYQQAVEAFERATAIGLPRRMFWYQFGPFEAYNRAGQYQKALDLSARVLAVVPMIEELHYQRGVAYLGLGEQDRAAEEFRTALAYNPRFYKAAAALGALMEGTGGLTP